MSTAPHKARIGFIGIPPFGALTIGGNAGLGNTVRPCATDGERPPTCGRGCASAHALSSEASRRERIALPQVSRRKTDAEPLHALRRGTVHERFGNRVAARALL